MMGSEVGIAIALIALLFMLLIIGLEIGWSVGITAVIGLVWYVDQPLGQLAETAFGSLNSFTLTALPLFIFMGGILGNTGVNEKLFSAIEKWVANLPGGLACSVICGNAVFGAMCGSTIAATATFGKIAFPVMEKKNYSPKLALGAIASGTVLAPLIPPSILLILYGAWQGLSIVDLLAAGLIPGLTLTILFILTIIIQVKLKPELAPPAMSFTMREKLLALIDVLPFMGVILGVLGAIFGGIMTPTEAAGLGAFLSILLTLAYRRLTFEIVKRSLLDTVKITSFSLFIMAMATLISHVFNSAGIIPLIKEFIIGLPIGKYGILMLFFVMYLLMGMFFDSWSMLFLTFPFVMPVIVGLDINPVWWGIIYVMAGEQSTITPPFGLSLFVLKGVVPKHSIGTIVRGSLPFLIPIYINVLLLFLFPQLALWLPSVLKGG
ncbi:TRAP transporter large permease [Desulforhopalus singaporensis]|uniref:TRAP transporter, DctM subunit n=1 Tax=Desulforhopalus singaporensis TaxID=91360 RepID=A0A1H0N7Y4_9BACT|nr:TRAP transporter large permease subunit [Desulforhopalus singaporensis]SDO88595.1 TRAP transporter, DctM subunit [Desulforhopalus singaporensis]